MAKTITVRARHRGQRPDGVWAAPGDTFDIAEDKLGKWMEKVDTKPKAKPAEQSKADK